jgi:hypothetical protein
MMPCCKSVQILTACALVACVLPAGVRCAPPRLEQDCVPSGTFNESFGIFPAGAILGSGQEAAGLAAVSGADFLAYPRGCHWQTTDF